MTHRAQETCRDRPRSRHTALGIVPARLRMARLWSPRSRQPNMSIREKTLNLRFTTIVSALLAGGALSTAQAAVPASGQSRVIRATLTDLGVAPANTVKTIALSLPLRNKDALTAFVASTVD